MPDQGYMPGKTPSPAREPMAGQLFQPEPKELNGELQLFQPEPKELNGELQLFQEFELSMALDMTFAMVSIMRNITPNMAP
jgi:hypothetical protein